MSTVDPQTILQYLLEQGVPRAHALGMVNNIHHESSFRPGINEQNPIVAGSRGGYGLFQHTGPRRRALESYAEAQGKPVSDWQVQIDYALSEPDTARYLNQSFNDPASASSWFTQHWERPQNAAAKARQRLSTLNRFAPDVRMASVDYGPGSTDTDRTPTGNPMTGRMDMNFDNAQQEPLGIHPQLQALIQGQQPDKRTQILNMVGALGRGILSSGGGPGAGNWFGNAANQAFAELAAQRPDKLNGLQILQANNELWKLEESRRERQMQRKQRLQQEAYLRNLAENHPDPSVRFQAEQQLMGVDEIDLPGPDDWEVRGSPSEGLYRVNAGTGEMATLMEPVETDNAATYGTAPNWARNGTWEDGSTKWSMVRTNDAGEYDIVDLPKGMEPWTGVQNSPELIREREVARGYGGMEPEAIRLISEQTIAGQVQVARTEQMLKELESGKYDNDVGPIKGRLAQFFSSDTALMQMYSVNAALEGLQTVNLAPVSNFEIGLVMKMDANAFANVEQNKAITRRLLEIRKQKLAVLRKSMKMIREEGYEGSCAIRHNWMWMP